MKTLNTTKVLICLLWLGSVGGVGAQPDQIDNKTAFTVSEPMEVPGAVLHPGSYIIRSLKKPSTQRTGLPPFNILQLLSADEKQLYATIVSIPEYYPPPSDQPIFTFYERSSNFPRAIKAWWPAPNPYPYAEQFAYPRTQALEVESAAKMQTRNVRGVAQDRESFTTTGSAGSASVFRGSGHRSQFALGREAWPVLHCEFDRSGNCEQRRATTLLCRCESGKLAVRRRAFETSHFVSTKSQ